MSVGRACGLPSAVPPPGTNRRLVLGRRWGISAFGLRLLSDIECSASDGSNSSALRRRVSRVAARRCTPVTMASADFCHPIGSPYDEPSPKAGRQISQGKTRDFPPIYPPHLRRLDPNDIGLRVYWPSHPSCRRLVCGSCSSGQEFAFHFLQIPPRGGHPCGSARSSCHQGLHRDFHPTSHIPVRFRSPVISVRS